MSGEESSDEQTHDADRWGIVTAYRDSSKRMRTAPRDTVEAIANALGANRGNAPAYKRLTIVRQGQALAFDRPVNLVTEGGAELVGLRRLPRDLAPGYHRIDDPIAGATPLAVVPSRCAEPNPGWGWSCQLYATRSTQSWGIGDFADLRSLGTWSRHAGATLLVVNPLHAGSLHPRPEPCPYYPSSRRYRNPIYLRIEEVPGSAGLPGIDEMASQGRVLNADRRIDHGAVWRLKSRALDAIFKRSTPSPAFENYLLHQGEPLEQYATFCVIAERHGGRWRDWPLALRHPSGPAVHKLRESESARVRFHAWLQWLIDTQLERAASEGIPPIQDLAVGISPDGADAWALQDLLAPGFTVGAPPDTFNTLGQDWGLAAFDPWRLRASGYQSFIDALRAAFRHAGGLRVDHVMGLFRLFWVPVEGGAAAGTYVRFPDNDLLDLLILEAWRAGIPLIGEDLGTVAPGVRRRLGARGVLSYRLLWFNRGRPETLPRQSLAAITTHDLPTVAGVWSGSDVAAQRSLGRHPNDRAEARVRRRLGRLTGLGANAPAEAAVAQVHAALGRSPSLLRCATLDDALAVEQRPNMPGTGDDLWPNWSLALPATLEELRQSPLAADIARSLQRPRAPSEEGA